MPRKALSKFVYSIYNLIYKNQLALLYSEVKNAQSSANPIRSIEIENYIKKWGFSLPIEKNPLMGKDNVKKWIEKVDEKRIKSWAYTGGSYGEPLRVPYSQKRNFIRTSTFKYFNEVAGYQLGDPFVLIRAKDKSTFLKYLRNETILIPHDLSEVRMEEFVKILIKKRIKVLMGYPSVMFELALYLKKYPDKKVGLKIESLISVSEPLEDFKRKIIYEVMQCNFIDRYSNEEVGMIAQQKMFGGEHFVNRFGVYVEVVDPDTLQPVPVGIQGKVVVTDIFNDLIPIIRYDTGDLATAHKYDNGQLISITSIVGRVTEQIIASNGRPVSPLILGPYIYKPLSRQGRVFQYQFAQINSSIYELRIKAKKGDLSEELLHEMTDGLISKLGDGSNVTVVHVDDIKPQPSGKRPVFKNEMISR